MAKVSHKALFEKLRDSTVINRNRLYAHWTLPKLMADFTEIRNSNKANIERDYQEIGALLVNNLAAKLARLLFPNFPFFRITASEKLKKAAEAQGIESQEFVAGLAKAETEASARIFVNAGYAQLILALCHLIVTGNVLVYRDSANGKFTTYGLQSYVVRRDGKGEVLDSVLREYTYVEGLPEDVQRMLRIQNPSMYGRPEKEVEVYTRIHRESRPNGPVYVVTQQVDTIDVGQPSTYPVHLCPWIFATWSLIHGEHYGRGMVEDYAGGFAKLSDVSEAHGLYLVEMLRILNLVSAGSGTDVDDMVNAESGQWVRGDPNTVNAYESGNALKAERAAAELQTIFGRLASAFMYGSNTRDAERVTAEEIRRDADEADNSLGGVYSSLSSSVQIPLANVLLTEVRETALVGILSGNIKLEIIAGIPALGRSTDVQNLLLASQEIAAVAGLSQMDNRFSLAKLVDVILAGRSVDPSSVFNDASTQEKINAASRQEAAGQAQLLGAAQASDQIQAVNELTQGMQ